MRKWYRKTDDTSIYFVSHGNVFIVLVIGHMYNSPIIVLDPTRKLTYLNAAWEGEWVEKGMERMRKIVRFISASSSRTQTQFILVLKI